MHFDLNETYDLYFKKSKHKAPPLNLTLVNLGVIMGVSRIVRFHYWRFVIVTPLVPHLTTITALDKVHICKYLYTKHFHKSCDLIINHCCGGGTSLELSTDMVCLQGGCEAKLV